MKKAEVLATGQRDATTVAAAGIPLRLTSGKGQFRPVAAVSDSQGRAVLPVLADIDADGPLDQDTMLLEGRWEESWSELCRINLTAEHIAGVNARWRRHSMAIKGAPGLPPFTEVSVRASEGLVKAGENCDISVTVTNVGKGAFYQLAATAESADAAVDGARFEFGMLAPGKTRTVQKTIRIPLSRVSGPAAFRLVWSELNDYLPDEAAGRVVIKGKDRAAFATSVQVIDDMSGNSVGNGDGRIQKGEAVDLLVTVRNVGNGVAKGVRVELLDLETIGGVVVNKNEDRLASLAPGETSQVRLTVTTKKTAKTKSLRPRLKVTDHYLKVTREERLDLPLDQDVPEPILSYQAMMYVDGDDAIIRAGAGDDTAVLARATADTPVEVTGELGRWYRVKCEGVDSGWIAQAQLTAKAPQKTAAPVAGAGGVITVLQNRGPMIVLTSPAAGATATRAKVTIQGVAADDQGVTRLRIRLNGEQIVPAAGQHKAIGLASVADASGSEAKRELTFAAPARLIPGANEIEITAWDADGLVETKSRRIIFEESTGRVHLVAIGVNAYEHVKPRLRYAAEDARAVAACLQKHLKVSPENTTLLVDKQATRRAILRELGDRLRNKAAREDTVIIYFSGHGAPEADPRSPDNDGVEKYLLPVDAEKDALFSTALRMEDVRQIFRRIDSERVIFLADSCYSGQAGGRSLTPGRRYRNIDQGRLLKRLQETGKGRVIITASGGSEVSQEDEKFGHGVFTYYLLRGLDGRADADDNGEVTIFELFTYVNREVPRATGNRQHPKAKMEDADGGIVISFPVKKGA